MPKPGSIKKQPEEGTLVRADEAALVVGEDGELRLILPMHTFSNSPSGTGLVFGTPWRSIQHEST